MPAVHLKVPVLGGRGAVIEYANRPGKFFYRELVEGCRRYKSVLIKNARTIQEAERLAIEAYDILREESSGSFDKQNKSHNINANRHSNRLSIKAEFQEVKKLNIAEAVREFLQIQAEKLEAGQIKYSTLKEKKQVLETHLMGYLNSENIQYISQINIQSFEHYLLYRKVASKLTRRKELVIIKHFIHSHLVKNKLIDTDIGLDKELIPRVSVKKQDLDANPAINSSDWRILNNYMRLKYVKSAESHPRKGVEYWRRLFYAFTLVAKNTGCRPNELLNLQWKDVEFEDLGTISKSSPKKEERLIAHLIVRASKTGEQREIPANVGEVLKNWLFYQRDYIKEHRPNLSVNRSTLVFGNPNNEMRAYSYSTYTAAWKKIMDEINDKIKGHKFSSRKYTIYSMRSTYIENKLINGMDIFLLARLCGHSVAMLMKHYERIDVRKRADEITHIDLSKIKSKANYIQLI